MSWPIIPNLPYIVLLCAGASLLGRYTARQICDRMTCQVTRWASRLFWPLALLLVIQVLVLEPAREVEAPAAVEAPVQATGATP